MGKILFYKQRTFSEIVNVTFEFIRENWRPVLKYMVYILLPLSLVLALVMNEFYKITGFSGIADAASYGYNNEDITLIIYFLAVTFVNFIGMVLFHSLIFTLIELYNTRSFGLSGISWSDIRPVIWKFFGKSVALSLTLFFIILIAVLVVGLLVVATPFTLILTIPAFIAALVPLAFAYPEYLYGKGALLQSLSHSYTLGWRCWVSIFGISLLTGLISGVLQTITSMPQQVTILFRAIMASSNDAEAMSPLMSFIFYIFGVISSFGGYVASTVIPIAISYLYAHAKEKYDGLTMFSDIENFDRLGEREQNQEQKPYDLI